MRRVVVVRAASAPAKQSAYIRSVLEEKRLLEGAPCEPGFRVATARTLRAVAVSAEGAVRVGYSTLLGVLNGARGTQRCSITKQREWMLPPACVLSCALHV
jgi:hypothetical protein